MTCLQVYTYLRDSTLVGFPVEQMPQKSTSEAAKSHRYALLKDMLWEEGLRIDQVKDMGVSIYINHGVDIANTRSTVRTIARRIAMRVAFSYNGQAFEGCSHSTKCTCFWWCLPYDFVSDHRPRDSGYDPDSEPNINGFVNLGLHQYKDRHRQMRDASWVKLVNGIRVKSWTMYLVEEGTVDFRPSDTILWPWVEEKIRRRRKIRGLLKFLIVCNRYRADFYSPLNKLGYIQIGKRNFESSLKKQN